MDGWMDGEMDGSIKLIITNVKKISGYFFSTMMNLNSH